MSVSEEIATTLRGLMLLDAHCERVVFGTHTAETALVLAATEEELEELVGFVATRAVQAWLGDRSTPNRDAAIEALRALDST